MHGWGILADGRSGCDATAGCARRAAGGCEMRGSRSARMEGAERLRDAARLRDARLGLLRAYAGRGRGRTCASVGRLHY
jgi:hypothetical protein